ncbi:hypothetical protein EDD22DRAFT_921573 [Suillus occidentalis]|nr:hypothetical protein EDD22DRAFT_921573 [Suillus occidentalis]
MGCAVSVISKIRARWRISTLTLYCQRGSAISLVSDAPIQLRIKMLLLHADKKSVVVLARKAEMITLTSSCR